MTVQDDRAGTEILALSCLIGGLDPFMSGWGGADNGRGDGESWAFWACKPEDEDTVTEWVEDRGDLEQIQTITDPGEIDGAEHIHVYAIRDGHPALV